MRKIVKETAYRDSVQWSFQQVVSENFLTIFGHFVLLWLTTTAAKVS